jgi:hypothetical protein
MGDRLDAKYPDVEFNKPRQLGSVLRRDYGNVSVKLNQSQDSCWPKYRGVGR